MSPDCVAIFANLAKPAARRVLPRLKGWLRARGVRVVGPARAARAQLAVALGGDGTLLSAARCLAPHGIPVLGINLGHMGFLAATDSKQAFRTLSALFGGRLALSRRMMISVRHPRLGAHLALNDCVIRVGSGARVIRLSAWVDGDFLGTFVGDGLILSTPTGSTAYSLAASGPLAVPEMELILLTPICSHSLTQRPVILAAESVIEVEVEHHDKRDRVVLSLDGQINVPLRAGERVRVQRAQERLEVYCHGKKPFFPLLREKLNWGERGKR